MVLHDLNLAARYADHLVVMADGRIARARATPATVLTVEIVAARRSAWRRSWSRTRSPATPLVVPVSATAGDARIALG